ERHHGILKDHGNAPPPQAAASFCVNGGQFLAIEQNLSRCNTTRLLDQAHQGESRHALAGSAFSDKPQNLSAVQLKRDLVDSPQGLAVFTWKFCDEVTDI